MVVVSCKVLHFIDDANQEAFGYKTLSCTNTIASHKIYEFYVSVSILDVVRDCAPGPFLVLD